MFAGGCLLYSSSRTQRLVSLSNAEAEVYACSSGASDAVMLARLLTWMNGTKTTIHLHTDSSGAKGILLRQGVGKVRHLSCRILWLQDLINNGQVKLSTVPGALNPADIGTKRLPCNRLKSLMSVIGMYNLSTGNLEGSDDPGNLFRKKQHVLSVLSVLGLLNLKGCSEDMAESSDVSFGMMAFTFVLGFLCLLAWRWMRVGNVAHMGEPDEEPMVNDGASMEVDSTGGHELPSSSAAEAPTRAAPVLTAENYILWLLERCSRRRDQAMDDNRRQLYQERVTILYSLKAALESPHEMFRASARRALGTITDISDDENSPNYSRINGPASLGEAQRALAFLNSLQAGPSSASGFTSTVDAVADALTRNSSFPPASPGSSSGVGESRSEAMGRYMSSRRSDVSDPSLWNYLHYGDEISDESPSQEVD